MENKARNQLSNYAVQEKNTNEQLTMSSGCPVGQRVASLTVGPRGPMLLQDNAYLDDLAHFDRERIPERVVHAKGAGAFGYFEVTHDITKYTKAVVFNKIGKKTPVAVRFSTVIGERGSADTARDPRGFAMKFYTEHGIWDMVANNTPIFFVRDPILFSSVIHAMKRNPVTHLYDANTFWDFMTLRPETCHQLSFLFSDRGVPDGYRHMNGYGSHTFKLINEQDVAHYCKFHFKTDQGIRNLSASAAGDLRGADPDYSTQDLYNAIANGKYPSWTLYIQVMTIDEADKCSFNPFDLTKVWPHGDYPLIPVGKLHLKRNPANYFAEVEQIAFSPAHLIPGIDVSPDKMLQGRLPSYDDTQRHRLGPNYMQLPVNCPFKVRAYIADGYMNITDNNDGAPNYFPNSFKGPHHNEKFVEVPFTVTGEVRRYDSTNEDNFSQVGVFWRKVLDEDARTRLIQNMAYHMKDAAMFIQQRAIDNFTQCDAEYGRRLSEILDKLNNESFNRMRMEQHKDEDFD